MPTKLPLRMVCTLCIMKICSLDLALLATADEKSLKNPEKYGNNGGSKLKKDSRQVRHLVHDKRYHKSGFPQLRRKRNS